MTLPHSVGWMRVERQWESFQPVRLRSLSRFDPKAHSKGIYGEGIKSGKSCSKDIRRHQGHPDLGLVDAKERGEKQGPLTAWSPREARLEAS